MRTLKLAFVCLLFPALPSSAEPNSAADSLALREIADSVHTDVRFLGTRWDGGRVTWLRIFYQGRGALPSALASLDSLHYFGLNLSAITSLPKEIGRLKRLDTLDIGSADIGPTLPDEIGDLENLRCLKCYSCGQLQDLPVSLMKLKKMEMMDFRLDPLCHLDDSLQRWILSISPTALDNPRPCLPTKIQPGKSPARDRPTPKLASPGERPGPNRDPEGKTRYYSPAGRRLRTGKAGPGV
jgi:hypothetical protein